MKGHAEERTLNSVGNEESYKVYEEVCSDNRPLLEIPLYQNGNWLGEGLNGSLEPGWKGMVVS